MSHIAFLGLGAMGSRMAANLLKADQAVTVWNRSREPAARLGELGASLAATPRAAAAGARIVISMVTDDAASRDVWLHADTGAAASLEPGTIAIEASTVTPVWIGELAQAVHAKGAAFLDAPVAGSRPQAEAGQLIFLVGGEAAVFDRIKPLLEIMGGAVHHVGRLGQGAVFKLAVNALFGIQVAALGELLGFLGRAGLDRARAVGILSSLPITSPAAAGTAELMMAGNFAPMFPIDLVEKDFGYALESAQAVGASLPTTDAVRRIYAEARLKGHGGDNIAGVVQLFT